MLHSLLMVVHVICAVFIVLLVLVQRGKGADAGAGFGSGASGTVFGARGASTALSRATGILAAIFMITSLSLAYTGKPSAPAQKSLLDTLSSQQQGGATAPADAAPVAPVAPEAPKPAQ
ncbi:MAG: preprotein translocase subunit SecG [Pseudomonadota bacterium]|jgi:preprotein translocase subunit SecG